MPQFHHPNTGFNSGVTAIQRKNAATQRWENAGQIEWSSNTSGAVYFGVERVTRHSRYSGYHPLTFLGSQVSIRELRKPKKPSSK